MADYWFKPKPQGYGATPANWKGWAAIGGFMAIVLSLALSLARTIASWPADVPAGPVAWQVATLLILVAAMALGFVWLCRKKTDEQWAWRSRKER